MRATERKWEEKEIETLLRLWLKLSIFAPFHRMRLIGSALNRSKASVRRKVCDLCIFPKRPLPIGKRKLWTRHEENKLQQIFRENPNLTPHKILQKAALVMGKTYSKVGAKARRMKLYIPKGLSGRKRSPYETSPAIHNRDFAGSSRNNIAD